MNKLPVSNDAATTSRNLMGAGLFKIIQVLAAIIFAALIPRTMGADNYGEFSFLISIVTIAGSLVTLAVGATFGRFFPEFKANKEEGNIKKLFMNMLFFKVCFTSFVCLILTLIMTLAFGDRYPLSLVIFIGLIVFFTDLEATLYGALFGHNKIILYSAREPIRRLFSVALIFVFFKLYGLHGAIFSSFLLAFCMVLTGLYFSANMLIIERRIISFSYFRKYLMFGLIISGAWVLTNIWRNGGNILIGIVTNDLDQVAYFDISQRIFQITMAISMVLITSLIPIFSKLMIEGKLHKISQWSRRIVKYTSILNVMVISFLFVSGHDFVGVVIGKEYSDVNQIAVVLMLSMFPFGVAQIGYVHSIIFNRSKIYFLHLAISVTVFTALSFVLIPTYSAMGCAVSSVIAYTLFGALTLRAYRESMTGCFGDLLKVLLAAACTFPILLMTGDWMRNLMIEALYIGAFVLLIFLFGLLKVRELSEILSVFRNRSQATP